MDDGSTLTDCNRNFTIVAKWPQDNGIGSGPRLSTRFRGLDESDPRFPLFRVFPDSKPAVIPEALESLLSRACVSEALESLIPRASVGLAQRRLLRFGSLLLGAAANY